MPFAKVLRHVIIPLSFTPGFDMIRPSLLAAFCLATPLAAEQDLRPDLGVCQNIPFSQQNCVRVVGCIGDQGLQIDGRARGWDRGTVFGEMSDFTQCQGTWDSDGPLGTGIAHLTCTDGTTMDVIYYNQDNITGTVIGRGQDSLGRQIQVWSGENVLDFLTPDGSDIAYLPCASGDIPIS